MSSQFTPLGTLLRTSPKDLSCEFSGLGKLEVSERLRSAEEEITKLRVRKQTIESELSNLNTLLSRWHRVAIMARYALTPVEKVPEKGTRTKASAPTLESIAESLGVPMDALSKALELVKGSESK